MREPIAWNEVKALFESQEKKITFIAEGMADIHPRIVRLEEFVASLTEDMGLLKPAVQRIERRLSSVDERLKTVEAR